MANIWRASLADMKVLIRSNDEVWSSLCVLIFLVKMYGLFTKSFQVSLDEL